jgi:cytochrome c-type biogenesis protein CcmH/NrfF
MRAAAYIRDHRFRAITALVAGVLLLLGAGDNSSRVDHLGHQLMCMCSCSQILLECNHVGCAYSSSMTKELQSYVDAGRTDKEVLAAFVEKYGTTVLAAPTHSGFDRVAWIMPYLALLVGIGGVALVVRAWHRRYGARAVPVGAQLSPADLSRLREQARRETDL